MEDAWVELVKKLNILISETLFFWKTINQRFFKLQGSFISTSEIWAYIIHNHSRAPQVATSFYSLLTGCKWRMKLQKTFRRRLMYFQFLSTFNLRFVCFVSREFWLLKKFTKVSIRPLYHFLNCCKVKLKEIIPILYFCFGKRDKLVKKSRVVFRYSPYLWWPFFLCENF